MTTTDTEAALLAAIAAHPEEDTPRLMLADELQERGEQDRAEFIRVQCLPCTRCDGRGGVPVEGMRAKLMCPHCKGRESALIAKHPEWRPACLRCKGEGEICTSHRADCYTCTGTGRIGTPTRGFLESVTVPTLATVLVQCRGIRHIWPAGSGWQDDKDCRTCHGSGLMPTLWARDLVRHRDRWPLLREVRVADRVPHNNGYGYALFNEGRYSASSAVPETAEVPHIVFTEMVTLAQAGEYDQFVNEGGIRIVDGRFLSLDSPDATLAALGAAVWRVLVRLVH
jgi:uncharacterized protein (TIGR02996 family)